MWQRNDIEFLASYDSEKPKRRSKKILEFGKSKDERYTKSLLSQCVYFLTERRSEATWL